MHLRRAVLCTVPSMIGVSSIAIATRAFIPLRRFLSQPPPTLHCLGARQLSQKNSANATDAEDDEYRFDATEEVQREAAKANASTNLERFLDDLLPKNAPDAARTKIIQYLNNHPVDALITSPTVQVTHIEENGEETKTSNLSPMPLKDAIDSARERGFCVVQMGERNGTAFVRIRNEKRRLLDMVSQELSATEEQVAASSQKEVRLKNCVDHIFRDVVDAHFISWKSKKIVDDLKKNHPVKIGIQQFQNAESAVSKLREMSNAMKQHAEQAGVFHHFTSINASDKEVSIQFSPSVQGKQNSSRVVKHPGEKEWNHTLNRLHESLRKSGRMGTYVKSDILKPRSLGATTYRVDKYGRRLM